MKKNKWLSLKRVLICLALITASHGWGQDAHFIYMQTANKAPFYVKMNGDLLSSTESGYIIIPQIIDEEVNVSIGFVKKQWPEQHYRIALYGKDKGMLVQFKENGLWDLIDLQTTQVLLTTDKMPASGEHPTDEFSRVLAEITDNSNLPKNTPGNVTTVTEPNQQIELVYSLLQKNRRKMIFELNTIRDQKKIETDTIELELDYRNAEAIEKENRELEEKARIEDSLAKMADLPQQPVMPDTVRSVVEEVKKNTEAVRFMACKHVAEEKDFVQLRKKMAGAGDESEMLELAGKAFNKKCYTTEQVRNLSMLILKEDIRYRFFEQAYPAVTDKANFALLQTLLQNEENISRFKTLIR